MGYLEYLTLQWLVVRYLEESRNFVVALLLRFFCNAATFREKYIYEEIVQEAGKKLQLFSSFE